jgi:hypothetical protein
MSALAQVKGMDKLIRKLRATPAQVKKVGDDLVKKHTRALISSSGKNKGLVQIVPPASMDRGVFGAAARQQGEAAIVRDVGRVYGTASHIYEMMKAKNRGAAAGYWQAIKRKDFIAANALARRMSLPELIDFTRDEGAEHQRRRGPNGRVRGDKPSSFIQDPRYLRAWLKRKQKNVGMAAASLVLAYDARFGSLAGVPAWVRRHTRSFATSRMTTLMPAAGMRVRIEFKAGATSSAMQRMFTAAGRFRIGVMQREAPHALRGYLRSLKL